MSPTVFVQSPMRFAVAILGLAISFLVQGCFSVSALFGPKVLEKSKEQTPPWVSVKPSQLIWLDSGYQFHGVLIDQMDLPLGVKRAQLSATQLSELAIVDAARQRVSEVCKADLKVAANSRIADIVSIAVKKQFGATVRVADIYYEKLEAPDTGDEKVVKAGYVYNIHVLVTFPRDQYEISLQEVARQLKRESGVETRRCGDALAASFGAPPPPPKGG
jgi:hypothetical protein